MVSLMWRRGLLRSSAGKALGECIQIVAERQGVAETGVGYEDVARAAFGRAGQVAVSVSIYTELYGICAVLFIVMVRRQWKRQTKHP